MKFSWPLDLKMKSVFMEHSLPIIYILQLIFFCLLTFLGILEWGMLEKGKVKQIIKLRTMDNMIGL